MPENFETWFMRGLVGVLIVGVWWFFTRDQRAIGATLDGVKDALGGLDRTLTELRVTIAKEYVTWDDLEKRCDSKGHSFGDRRSTAREKRQP